MDENLNNDDINVIGTKRDALVLGEDPQDIKFRTIESYIFFCINNARIYKEYIETKRYNLTIDNICDMLDVPENYVQRYIIKYLDRIYLTKAARFGFKHIEEISFDRSILSKKILISEESFNEYLSNNLIKNSDRIAFNYQISDFAQLNMKQIELRKRINSMESNIDKQFKDKVKYEFDLSNKELQSIDLMKVRLGLRHNTQIYRLIRNYSYQKFTLNKNTIRYSVSEEDIKKIIIENKEKIIHTTLDNIEALKNDSDDKIKDEEIIIQFEKYALSIMIDCSNLSYNQIKSQVLNYTIDYIKSEN